MGDVSLGDLADDVADLARELEQLRVLQEETKGRLDNAMLDIIELVRRLETGTTVTPPYAYEDWHTWVVMWLEPRISRAQQHRWCLKLDEHPEAELRLGAAWHAWEASWPKQGDRASWLRDVLDPQLAWLMASDGPLRLCSATEHQHGTPPDLHRSA